MQLNRKWRNPRWGRPKNFDCVYLRFQTGQPTRYNRNSNSLTYVFEVQHSTGTYENTVRPNRQWKSPRWRQLNFNCVFLHSKTRYRRNSNGYTHVLGVQHSNETCSDTMQTNRKWAIQDGGLKTSNACISASRLDINEIPTAMPMFAGSSFPMRLIRRLCDQTENGEFHDGGK